MNEGAQGMHELGSRWIGQRAHWWLLVITGFFVYDIVLDVQAGEVDLHLVVESVVFFICTVILLAEWRRNRRLHGTLVEVRARNDRLSGQFSDYVRDRFAGWSLSPSEGEVAWLILKGYSFPEIAGLRSVQEKTVRQQATAIYAKSGCRSRNEFIAHFIADLLAGDVGSAEANRLASPAAADPATEEAGGTGPAAAASAAGHQRQRP